MVVVMRPGAPTEDIDAVVARVESAGGEAFVSRGVQRTIIGLVGDITAFHALNLRAMPSVGEVVRVSKPYKLVSRENHPEATTVTVGGVPIGPGTFTLIAGPCAVETPEQTLQQRRRWPSTPGPPCCAAARSSPAPRRTRSRGLGLEGLKILAEVRGRPACPW